jgi:hypothetical protein
MQQLILRLIDKYLCKHEWETHAKKEYSWETEEVSLTSTKDAQVINKIKHVSVKEILICQQCGKIHSLEY